MCIAYCALVLIPAYNKPLTLKVYQQINLQIKNILTEQKSINKSNYVVKGVYVLVNQGRRRRRKNPFIIIIVDKRVVITFASDVDFLMSNLKHVRNA